MIGQGQFGANEVNGPRTTRALRRTWQADIVGAALGNAGRVLGLCSEEQARLEKFPRGVSGHWHSPLIKNTATSLTNMSKTRYCLEKAESECLGVKDFFQALTRTNEMPRNSHLCGRLLQS
jgi:hypothetical protein